MLSEESKQLDKELNKAIEESKVYPSKDKIYLTKKQKKRGETPWAKYRSMESVELEQELDKMISEVRKELKGEVVDPDFQVPLKSVNFSPFNQSETQKEREKDRVKTKK